MSIFSRVSVSVLTLGLGLASACGGDDDGGSGNCPEVSGTWSNNSGTCPVSSCTVVQNGCSLQVDCGDIRISGTIASVNGESASVTLRNSSGSCSGQVDDIGAGKPPELEVDCTIDGQACDAKLDCESGACVATGNSSNGSGGGSNGSGGGSNGSGGGSNGSGGGSNGSGGGGDVGCCDSSDSCDYANDDFCDCPDQAWDAADCAGGSGGSGSGGSGSGGGGGNDRGAACELGAAAVCVCLDGTDSPCVGDDAVSLYNGCVSQLADAEFIYCFAGYVDTEGGINCATAANACIP